MNFEEAQQDKYCLKIMNLLARWLPKLDKSELKQLQLIALWEACETFDSSKSKFTTHLYNRIRFKYLKHINSKKNKLGKSQDIWYNINDVNLNVFFDGLSQDNREVLEDRFVYKHTLRDMAKKRGLKINDMKEKIEKAKGELWKLTGEEK